MLSLKTWIAIHLFLVLQIAAPVAYYITGDELDERFAWRMFSTTRNVVCRDIEDRSAPPQFFVDGEPIRPYATFHEGWVSLFKRARPAVLEAAALKLCRDNPGKAVTLRYECRTPENRVVRYYNDEEDLCR